MPVTSLLPPMSAARIVWALAAAFSDDEQSQTSVIRVEDQLGKIQAQAEADPIEKSYVLNSVAAMQSTLRSLDIIHKGRTLNFEENEKLRAAYLESVRESIEFGNSARDFLKSLPSMTIGAAGGLTIGKYLNFSEAYIWIIGLGLAAIGYLVNLLFVRNARRTTQKLYVAQDYERGLYYGQYLKRSELALRSLYLELERIHETAFGNPYVQNQRPEDLIGQITQGVRPTFCKYVHRHFRGKKITPELWSLCETGDDLATQSCPLWDKN